MDAYRLHTILVGNKLVPDNPFVTLTAEQLMRLDNLALDLTEECTVEGAENAEALEHSRRRIAEQVVVINELRHQLHRAERVTAIERAQLVIPFADRAFTEPKR